ncbi:MAG: hypothetical protein Q7S57_06230 [bacterium]|nr:hypothetical protein [bacterium]
MKQLKKHSIILGTLILCAMGALGLNFSIIKAQSNPVAAGQTSFISQNLKPITLNTFNSSNTAGETVKLFETSSGKLSRLTKTTFDPDTGEAYTKAATKYLGSDQQVDFIARKKIQDAAEAASKKGGDLLSSLFGKKPTNDGCALVTPGQTPEYGNMWGEEGVAKDPGGKDAFGNEALKGMESPTNKELREKHLGYRDDDALKIAKTASADPIIQNELSLKEGRSNADWAGWKGETPLPGENEAKEHMSSPKGGYKTKGGSKMYPTKKAGVGAYVKGQVYDTADGKKAKVTADCSFVEATQEDFDNLQKSAADAAQKFEPPAVPPPAVPPSSSSLLKPVTNMMSNLTPFPFNMFESLAGNIGIQTWQLFGGV